ncbi:Macrolide export ATP-binding/permease protein MacB [Lacunisphaera limnophila]|uniref:Macrolide export ATP-binding/permease protein MacB n=1 Tax=Lacunisphaera limnophila TaxID=1838286 RepID=A0A1D8AVZ8_9BACT|nr:ABC transporter permease [Lacunisphaera limnophila]AOS45035.1 Macrolide export ATP-binding/permease protein MacB [Lacunisphaera limnophila]
MNTLEILRLALDSLKANKLRSGLTMLGIAVGVFSVIGVMTVISGLKGSIESGLNVLGANSFQFSKYPAINFSDPRQRFANRRDIDYTMAARFKELMGESAQVSLMLRRGGRVASYMDRRTNPNVLLGGADENLVTARNFEISAGRNLGPDDVEFSRAVALLGDELVQRLFPNENPLGRMVRIDGQNYTIVGLLAKKGSSFGQSQDNFAVIPITKFLDAYGRQGRSISINVQSHTQETLEATKESAVGTMRLVRGLDPEDPNDFEVFSNESLIEAFNNIANTVAIGAFVISAIALLASGVGVMNIMLVSVTERTKEIGIRKSIGAKKRNILAQFLIEAVILSLMGGLMGIAVGVIGGNIGAMMLNASAVFPWGWALAGMLVCSAIGIGFGFYPAWKAASLDPIEALRYE